VGRREEAKSRQLRRASNCHGGGANRKKADFKEPYKKGRGVTARRKKRIPTNLSGDINYHREERGTTESIVIEKNLGPGGSSWGNGEKH